MKGQNNSHNSDGCLWQTSMPECIKLNSKIQVVHGKSEVKQYSLTLTGISGVSWPQPTLLLFLLPNSNQKTIQKCRMLGVFMCHGINSEQTWMNTNFNSSQQKLAVDKCCIVQHHSCTTTNWGNEENWAHVTQWHHV